MPSQLLGVSTDVNGDTSTIVQSQPPALPEICAHIHAKVEAFLTAKPENERVSRVQDQTRTGIRVIEEALDRYSLDELSLSYNGGKDCLVLLIMYLAALHQRATRASQRNGSLETPHGQQQPFQLPRTLTSVYIISKHPFRAVDDFVESSEKTYHLDLARYSKSMKEAFSDYLREHPNVKAIFVGTRRTDPHGADLKHFDPTDRGWPPFMRIHPVIDWHYAEVWAFIRALEIPYCQLYDLGYTSLGGTTDTFPNPALKTDKEGEGKFFRPAYELEQDDEERLGRDR